MKIKKSQLRNFIRQQLKEMAYAGRFEPRYDPKERRTAWGALPQSGVSDLFDYGTGDDQKKHNFDNVKKYAMSKTFERLAKNHFANIPWNIWIAPLIGTYEKITDSADEDRAILEPLKPNGVNILKEIGYEIPENFGDNDVVILYSSSVLEKDFIATPWMIFHAMFDNENTEVFSETFTHVIRHQLMQGWSRDNTSAPENIAILSDDYKGNFWYNWRHALTMRSARTGVIRVESDAFAEIMCQELLTKSGFTINDNGAKKEYIEALYNLKPIIKKCADEFRANIRGKLIIVGVN
jgi:hypothetical protein